MPSTCSVLPRVLAAVEVADEQVDAHPHTLLIGCTQPMRTGKGPQMANSHPKLNPQNLRPPWPSGTSGNPAGYSQGRRLSDAIENMIDELGLERSFAATAIAMALGHKHTLRQLVKDPVTGVDVWVEHQPDLKWFKMIVPQPRIEPAAQQPDAVTRLRTILQNIDRKERDAADQGKAAESAGPSPSGPGESKETVKSASTLLQHVPAHAGSGQVALQAARADLPAGDPGTTSAVERPSGQRCVPIPALFWSCSILAGMLSGSRRSLTLSLRDCSRETSAALLPGSSGSGPDWQAGSAGRWRRSPSWLACCSFTRPSSSITSELAATSFRRARARLSGGPRLRLDPPYRRGSSLTSLHAIWLPARLRPGKLAPSLGPW